MNRSTLARRSRLLGGWVAVVSSLAAAGAVLIVPGCLSSASSSTPTPETDGGSPPGSLDGGVVSDGAAADAGSTVPSGAEGLYFGSLGADASASSTLAILITTGGHYWIWQYVTGTIYQGAVGVAASSASPTSVTITTTTAAASTPPIQATVAGVGTSITGTIGVGASAQPFVGTLEPTYTRPAVLGDAVGSWSSEVYSGAYGEETETITVSATGALQMVNPLGCTATGTLTPDPTYGFYTVNVTFQGASCIAGVSGATGVAVVALAGPNQPQLLTSILTADGTTNFPTWGVPVSPDGG